MRTQAKDLFKEWQKDPEYLKEYAALEEEFSIARLLVETRSQANLTQQEVAKRMKTNQAAIARLEGGRANPSLATLKRFAKATGTKLKIEFSAAK